MSFATDFATIHTMIGSPTMSCVAARTTWTNVPAGYSYDPAYDRFVNAGGTVWDETTVTLAATSVDIIPMEGQTLLDLIAGGVITVGDRVVYIKAADYTTVNAAAWCVLDSLNYDKVELTPFPASVPQWYIVNLRKR